MTLPHVDVIHRDETYMIFQGKDLISQAIRETGGYTPALAKIAVDILRNTCKDVLDIGANIGTFTIPVAKQIQGKVHAFEVQRVIYMQLCGNCILNRLDNVYCYHKCASSTGGGQITIPVVDFSDSCNNGCFSTSHAVQENLANHDVAAKLSQHYERVDTVCLDDYGFTNIGFIKLDVEGSELDVLKGMVKTLETNSFPPILFESWESHSWWAEQHKELLQFIESMGYNIYKLHDHCDNYIATHNLCHNLHSDA